MQDCSGLNFDLWFWFVVLGFVAMVVRWWLWSQLVDLWAVVGFVFMFEIKLERRRRSDKRERVKNG